jgi:hypothetical protein
MTKKSLKLFLIFAVLTISAVMLSACGSSAPSATDAPAPAPTQACPTQVTCPEVPETVAAPFEEAWMNSPHADKEAEAFRHWDEDTPPEVPAACAKCHSSTGFLDYVGADGSAAFSVEGNAPVDTVITCDTCHNDATLMLDKVIFPSGAEITGLGREAVCMTCHQGRASKVQVDAAIEKVAVADVDTVSPDLGFTNIHYFAAAASRYGSEVSGGYEYEGKAYDPFFEHVPGVQTCTDCHNSHSLEINIDTCATCHGVSSVEELKDVREPSSMEDYDGDGNVAEGIYYEIQGVQELLMSAIQGYAKEVAGTDIVYDAGSYQYFFADANANNAVDEGEGAYKSWTPRLLKAAYNYQMVVKDPGGYAHGGKYLIELMYDSTENLNEKLSTPVDLSKAHRIDAGHFAASQEAFRHWDEEGSVPSSCAKCHSAEGLPQLIAEGVNTSQPVSSGFYCETCHNTAEFPARYVIESVKFPSGAQLGFADKPDANLCISCHQGRESTVSVNSKIGTLGADEVSDTLGFRNVHYFAAGATLFGTEAKGAYEYDGQTYVGQFLHVDGFSTCVDCHDTHGLSVKTAACQGCHGTDDVEAIRLSHKEDYDGDGNTSEGIAGEISTMTEALYAALQAKAAESDTPIVYNQASYPYFFADENGNGVLDEGEGSFSAWTPRLLKAAYNLQYVTKDPGTFAHNGVYMMEVLYDAINDVGGDVTSMVRP